MRRPENLAEVLEGWPEEISSLERLATYDLGALKQIVADLPVEARDAIMLLRSQARDLLTSLEREQPFAAPGDVRAALLGGRLRPYPGRWMTYPLDRHRSRMAAPHKLSGSRFLVHISWKFPAADDLPPVEDGGSYLVVWGGDPSVLAIDGVMHRIVNLAARRPVLDVVFFDEEHRSMWSALERIGVSPDRFDVEFDVDLSDTVAEISAAIRSSRPGHGR